MAGEDSDIPEYDDLRSGVPPRSRADDLAAASFKVATANHYLVGVIGVFTREEYEGAKQRLIGWQHAGGGKGIRHRRLDLALDLIELELKRLDAGGTAHGD